MARLGSEKKPAVVRVRTENRARSVLDLCEERGWKVVVGIEPDQPEDLAQVQKLLEKKPAAPRPDSPARVSRNDYFDGPFDQLAKGRQLGHRLPVGTALRRELAILALGSAADQAGLSLSISAPDADLPVGFMGNGLCLPGPPCPPLSHP